MSSETYSLANTKAMADLVHDILASRTVGNEPPPEMQIMMEKVRALAAENGWNCVYGDSDSLMISVDDETLEDLKAGEHRKQRDLSKKLGGQPPVYGVQHMPNLSRCGKSYRRR